MLPESRPVNAFSVDVEDYFQVAAFDKVVGREDWDELPSRVVGNTSGMLEILDNAGVKATFFVLGWVAERHPKLVRQIADHGHEIGCHGYSHRRVYWQTPEEFAEETGKAKKLLEDAAGVAVTGYRAASFSITNESLWALDILVENGFEYDSSIFPVRHDNYGIPAAKSYASMIDTPKGAKIAELPMSTLSIFGYRLPVGGGGYFRLYPYWFSRWAMKRLNSSGRASVFYSHPWELDTHQPRFESAPALSKFRHYNNLDKFGSRVERLLSEFEFTTCRAVLERQNLITPRSAE